MKIFLGLLLAFFACALLYVWFFPAHAPETNWVRVLDDQIALTEHLENGLNPSSEAWEKVRKARSLYESARKKAEAATEARQDPQASTELLLSAETEMDEADRYVNEARGR